MTDIKQQLRELILEVSARLDSGEPALVAEHVVLSLWPDDYRAALELTLPGYVRHVLHEFPRPTRDEATSTDATSNAEQTGSDSTIRPATPIEDLSDRNHQTDPDPTTSRTSPNGASSGRDHQTDSDQTSVLTKPTGEPSDQSLQIETDPAASAPAESSLVPQPGPSRKKAILWWRRTTFAPEIGHRMICELTVDDVKLVAAYKHVKAAETEAVATRWEALYEYLTESGIPLVQLADPDRVRQILDGAELDD